MRAHALDAGEGPPDLGPDAPRLLLHMSWEAIDPEVVTKAAELSERHAATGVACFHLPGGRMSSAQRSRQGDVPLHGVAGDAPVEGRRARARRIEPWLADAARGSPRVAGMLAGLCVATCADFEAAVPLMPAELAGWLEDLRPAEARVRDGEARLPRSDGRVEGQGKVLDDVDRWIAGLGGTMREAALMDLGECRRHEVGATLAKEKGVSRSRIGQLVKDSSAKGAAVAWCRALLSGTLAHGVGRPLEDVPPGSPIHGVAARPGLLAFALAHAATRVGSVVATRSGIVEVPCRKGDWTILVKAAVLSMRANLGKDTAAVRAAIEALVDDAWTPAAKEVLRREAEGADVAPGEDVGAAIAARAMLSERLAGALRAAGAPMGREALLRAVKGDGGRPFSDGSFLREVRIVGLSDATGRIGLPAQHGLSDEAMTAARDAAHAVMATAPGEFWDSGELVGPMARACRRGLDRTLAASILSGDPRFRTAQVHVCRLADAPVPGWREATVAVLEEAGGPMSAKALRETVMAICGKSNHQQVREVALEDPDGLGPSPAVLRMDRGLWGLVGRDVPVTRVEARDWLAAYVATTERNGKPGDPASVSPGHPCSRLGAVPLASLALLAPKGRSKAGRLSGWVAARRALEGGAGATG